MATVRASKSNASPKVLPEAHCQPVTQSLSQGFSPHSQSQPQSQSLSRVPSKGFADVGPFSITGELRRPQVAYGALLGCIALAGSALFLLFIYAAPSSASSGSVTTKLGWNIFGTVFSQGASEAECASYCQQQQPQQQQRFFRPAAAEGGKAAGETEAGESNVVKQQGQAQPQPQPQPQQQALVPVDSTGSNVSAAHLFPPYLGLLSPAAAEYIQGLHSALAAAKGNLAVCLTGAAEGLASAAPWLGSSLLSPLNPSSTSLFVSARLDTGTDLLAPLLLRYGANLSIPGVFISPPLLQANSPTPLSLSASDKVLHHTEDDDLLRACSQMIKEQEKKAGLLFRWLLVAPLSVPWVGPLQPLVGLSDKALLMPSSSSGARLRAASAASQHPASHYSTRVGCQGFGFTALGARDSVLSALDAWIGAPLDDRCCRKCVTPAWAHALSKGVLVDAVDFPVCFGTVDGQPSAEVSVRARPGAAGNDDDEDEPECDEGEDGNGQVGSPASYWEASWKQRLVMCAHMSLSGAGRKGQGQTAEDIVASKDACVKNFEELKKHVGEWKGPSFEALCLRCTALGPLLALESQGIGGGDKDESTMPTPLLRLPPGQTRPFVVYTLGGAKDETWEDELVQALSPAASTQASEKGKVGDKAKAGASGAGAGTPPGNQSSPGVLFFAFTGSVTQLTLNSCRVAGAAAGEGEATVGEASCFEADLAAEEQRRKGARPLLAGPAVAGSLVSVQQELGHDRIDILKVLASPSEGFSLIPFQDKKLKICLLLLTSSSKAGFAPKQLVESLSLYEYELAGCSVCKGAVAALCCAWYSLRNCL